jgi:4-hydroxy-2-oxoheptanedioate aldolase
MILAAYAAATVPLVRVPKGEPHRIMQALDLGALGVLVPHVRSREEAEAVRDGALYPPRGRRGVGIGRAAGWGAVPLEQYFARMNDEILTMAMIEDVEAVEKIEGIVAAGLDVLFIGTADLATSLGVSGQFAHPLVRAACQRVLSAAKGRGVAVGFPARTLEGAKEAAGQGYRFITLRTAESYVFEVGKQFVSALRGPA